MAYSTGNPPRLIVSSVGGGPRMWLYSSTVAIATVEGSSYFSNGKQLGMGVNDAVFVVDTKNSLWSVVQVISTDTGNAVHTSSHTAFAKATS